MGRLSRFTILKHTRIFVPLRESNREWSMSIASA